MADRPDGPREAGLPEKLSGILAEDARWVASEADIRHVMDVWDELGIHCSPTALRFVEEFNGTRFDYPRHPLDPGTHSCELNAERASRIVNGEKLRRYEQRTGEKLTPVGTAASGPLVLLVAEGGAGRTAPTMRFSPSMVGARRKRWCIWSTESVLSGWTDGAVRAMEQ
ncbi:SUKH-3 domain-containing protein [Streptomyces gilvus]|uniref:SUKH-3 domain-containing protein n=1 Tax=Streptomyces gilvus TaxID=2920937 RepID=UPI001F0F84EE|nr:SUKH-3 domain-containing protein [Streptomyces sp. CME 23]MCH5671595.1 SUKH-3 domain-containing protein [Streptomyces sp. CME 23]